MGAPKLLMIELLKNVNLKIPLDLLARGIKLAIITEKKFNNKKTNSSIKKIQKRFEQTYRWQEAN